jgi:predicted DNA binding CopG/RHH family protein
MVTIRLGQGTLPAVKMLAAEHGQTVQEVLRSLVSEALEARMRTKGTRRRQN